MTEDDLSDLVEQADRLDGLFEGQCEPEEYLHLIAAGMLRRTYEGAAGFMGLATLRRDFPAQERDE